MRDNFVVHVRLEGLYSAAMVQKPYPWYQFSFDGYCWTRDRGWFTVELT